MPEQQLLRTPTAARQTQPPCCLARAHNARATRRPHDGTAHCRRHLAVPPTAEPHPAAAFPPHAGPPPSPYRVTTSTQHWRPWHTAAACHTQSPSTTPCPTLLAPLRPSTPAPLPRNTHRQLRYHLSNIVLHADACVLPSHSRHH